MQQYYIEFKRKRVRAIWFRLKAENPNKAHEKVIVHLKKEGFLPPYNGLRVYNLTNRKKIREID